MRKLFAAFLGLVLLASGATPALDSGATLGLVVIVIAAVATLAVLAQLVRPDTSGAGANIRAEGSIGIATPPAQSDPDAAGHSRPRAPGFAASAA
ncbi:MAG: DUF6412 domain-containing protein [Microbacterium sp.]|uniref:DUF6412 domain-containing protein n=1 Tax=Microbacterium sp. TaxID=51671 RepID=UPI002725A654|nr:DUF6412 domain-containing protein [Microbacterium sp.]MDO8384233.1 DUF6412 domain-containing protein [Microbacterium sp.]